ncbi:MAG: restriction endonuclease subunit S [Parcubacteria group bacterium]
MVIEETKTIADNIEDFIDVPDGIGRLRKAILTLAVSGNLVQQDQREGTAQDLYQKIQEERTKEAKRNGKKLKPLSPITDDEIPFDIPDAWKAVPLGGLGEIYNGNSINKQEKESKYVGLANGYPYIATKDVDRESHVIDYENGVKIPIHESNYKIAPKGSVLICSEGGNAGRKIGILEEDVCFGNKLIAIVASKKIEPRFVFYSYLADYFQNNFRSNMNGLIGGISMNNFMSLPFVLPPLPEQKRIVEKIDQLMKIIDDLETKKEERDVTRLLLAISALHSLGVNDSSIALEHMTELVRNLDDTKELEKGILSLAVSGKLVPQNPKEGIAEDLYQKIQEERTKEAKKTGKKLKSLPPITDEEIPLEIPESWKWVRIGDICLFKGGFAYKKKDFVEKGDFQVIRMGNVRPNYFRLDQKPIFTTPEIARKTQEYQICIGDILLTMTGTKDKRDYLYSLLVHEKDIEKHNLYLNQRLCILRPIVVNRGYLNLALKEDLLLDAVYAKSTGAANQANIGIDAINNWVIPLPPLAEQKRIVEKVDELMTLTKELKAILTRE